MKKLALFSILFLSYGAATADLGPTDTKVTINNNSSFDYSRIRIKVRFTYTTYTDDGKEKSNTVKGSVRIESLSKGESKTVDLKDATKYIRKAAPEGQKKGDKIGEPPRILENVNQDAITKVAIIKLRTNAQKGEAKHFRHIQIKEGSSADVWNIINKDAGATMVAQ